MRKKILATLFLVFFIAVNLLRVSVVYGEPSGTKGLLDWQKGWSVRQVHEATTELTVTPGKNGSVKVTTEAGKNGAIGLEQHAGEDKDNQPVPFTINGFKMKFKYKITDVNSPELRVIFLPAAAWYTEPENPVAFGLLIHYRPGNKAAFGPLTKKIGQTDAAHSPQEWAGDFDFYHDGSKENVLEFKFDGGKPYFFINGTKLEGYSDYLNAPGFLGENSTKSILDYYPGGKAYVQFFQTSPNNNVSIEITGIESQEPEFSTKGMYTGFSQYDPAHANPVGHRTNGSGSSEFKSLSSSKHSFYIKRLEPVNITGTTILFNLKSNMEDKDRFGLFFTDSDGKQIRVYIRKGSSKGTANIVLAKFDGNKETELGSMVSGFSFNGETPNNITIKKSIMAYKLFVNNEEMSDFTQALTGAIEKMKFKNQKETTVAIQNESKSEVLVSFTAFNKIGNAEVTKPSNIEIGPDSIGGNLTRFIEDGGRIKIFGDTSKSGAFAFRNTSELIWLNKFGIDFSIDKYQVNEGYFDIILSSIKDDWYTKGQAVILRFKNISADQTEVRVVVSTNGKEEELAKASTPKFKWVETSPNTVYLGKTVSGWKVIVNRVELALDKDISKKLDELTVSGGAFEKNEAYLQVVNEKDKGTAFVLKRIHHYLPNVIAPENWVIGGGSGPNWGISSMDKEVVFGNDGKGSFTTNTTSIVVPIENFKMDFNMYRADDSITGSYLIYIAKDSGWYSDTYAIGLEIQPLNPVDFTKAKVFFKYDSNACTDYDVMTFNWRGKNTWEIKKDQGVWKYFINGNELKVKKTFPKGALNGRWMDAKNRGVDHDGYVLTDKDGEIVKSTTEKATPVDSNIIHEKISEYMKAGSSKNFKDGFGTLQTWNNNCDLTVAISDLTCKLPNRNPVISEFIDTKDYKKGEEVTLYLKKYFSDPDTNDILTYTADTGVIEGTTWKFTPTEVGKIDVAITATDSAGLKARLIFTMNVISGEASGTTSKKSNYPITYVLIPLALLVVIGGITAFLVFKKKKSA